MATGNKSQKAEVRIRKPEIKTAIFYITDNGFALAKKLNSLYPDAKVFKFKPDTVSEFWGKRKSFIFIMASGIVLRTVAPLIKDKRTDPAVVALDEKVIVAVILLSVHRVGANKIAKERADVCVVPRAGVISEAMLAFVLAEAMLEKFGGDDVCEMKRNYKGYVKSLREP